MSFLLFETDAVAWMKAYDGEPFDLVMGSPPYPNRMKRYQKNPTVAKQDWLKLMLASSLSAIDLCRGYVVWVMDSSFFKGQYLAEVEELQVMLRDEARKPDAGFRLERPVIWIKNSPPSRQRTPMFFSHTYELAVVLASLRNGEPFFDGEAAGTPMKFKAGGRFRQRDSTGKRRLGSEYPTKTIARVKDVQVTEDPEPAVDVVRATVGGGHMGSKLATKNEAPYPESLVTPFTLAMTPKAGRVLDPFVGSGTTLAVAGKLGRTGVGLDIRAEAITLAKTRLQEAGLKVSNKSSIIDNEEHRE